MDVDSARIADAVYVPSKPRSVNVQPSALVRDTGDGRSRVNDAESASRNGRDTHTHTHTHESLQAGPDIEGAARAAPSEQPTDAQPAGSDKHAHTQAATPAKLDKAAPGDTQAHTHMQSVALWCRCRRRQEPTAKPFSLREWLIANSSYLVLHYIYYICLSLLGGAAIFAVEGRTVTYADALFTATSAVTVTGLVVIDTSTLSLGSQLIIFALIILGGAAFMSAVPVMVRRYYWRRHVERRVASKEEQQHLLQTEREYRALGWVVNLALTLSLGWPVVCAILWGIYCTYAPTVRGMLDAARVHPWWWAFFHAFAAYNNAGFALFADNLIQFAGDYAVLLIAAWLILVGNVAYPVMFRFVVWIVYVAGGRKDDSLAYLLERPRKCYTHMFPALATRMLFAAITAFTFAQWFMFLILDYGLDILQPYPGHIRALMGWFQSVSTRTAGFNVLDIAEVSAAMQLIYLFMMYISAYPTALAIRETGRREASRGKQEAEEKQRADDAKLEAALAYMAPSRAVAKTSVSARMTTGGGPADVNVTALASAARSIAREVELVESKASSTRSIGTPAMSPTPPGGSVRARSSRRRTSSTHSIDTYQDVELGKELDLGDLLNLRSGGKGKSEVVTSAEAVASNMTSIVSRDLVWLMFALVIICIAEQWPLHSTTAPRHFSVFGIMFEVISAYGTVGLSFGFPGTVTSLSAQFRVISKLVMCVVMLSGRHRGLPFSIDAAVYLPTLLEGRAAEAKLARERNGSETSFAGWSVAMLQRQNASMRSLRNVFATPPLHASAAAPNAAAPHNASNDAPPGTAESVPSARSPSGLQRQGSARAVVSQVSPEFLCAVADSPVATPTPTGDATAAPARAPVETDPSA